MKKQLIKTGDIILIAVIILTAVLSFFVFQQSKDVQAVIYLNGEEYTRLSLNEDKEILIDTVKILIKNGKIQMISSDCPDKVCVKTGAINKNGQVIACVPNKIVITVVKGNDNVDGVTG